MLTLSLHAITRGLVLPLALALPVVALAGCESSVGADARSISGTYTGSVTSRAGSVSYTLGIAESESNSFAVTGSLVEDGESIAVRGTALYDHPNITFELSRIGGEAEDLFGLSGEVAGSGGSIIASGEEATLTLKRR